MKKKKTFKTYVKLAIRSSLKGCTNFPIFIANKAMYIDDRTLITSDHIDMWDSNELSYVEESHELSREEKTKYSKYRLIKKSVP